MLENWLERVWNVREGPACLNGYIDKYELGLRSWNLLGEISSQMLKAKRVLRVITDFINVHTHSSSFSKGLCVKQHLKAVFGKIRTQ